MPQRTAPCPARRQGLRLAGAGAVLAAALLAGCASFTEMAVSVSSFGEWPGGRAPGSYAFDRLPSQQGAANERQRLLEEAASAALLGAGFKPVAAGAEPDVLVQLGARVNRADLSPWDDPLWWRGGWGLGRHRPWRGAGWGLGLRYDHQRFEREVAVLLRDRATGKPLYEAHAVTAGFSEVIDGLLAPMMAAALRDFPVANNQAHQVKVAL